MISFKKKKKKIEPNIQDSLYFKNITLEINDYVHEFKI